MRNPVTKLTNNWFGENERGIATGISIMSGPAGIFISKILIQTIMWNDDKEEINRLRARSNYEFFVLANSIIVTLMIIPAFFLIRDEPPTPPSKVASKARPHFSIWKSTKLILKNHEYLLVFIHF